MLVQIDTDMIRETREIKSIEDLKEIAGEYGDRFFVQITEKIIKVQVE